MFLNDDKKANNYYRFRNLFRKCLAPPFSKLKTRGRRISESEILHFFFPQKIRLPMFSLQSSFRFELKEKGINLFVAGG